MCTNCLEVILVLGILLCSPHIKYIKVFGLFGPLVLFFSLGLQQWMWSFGDVVLVQLFYCASYVHPGYLCSLSTWSSDLFHYYLGILEVVLCTCQKIAQPWGSFCWLPVFLRNPACVTIFHTNLVCLDPLLPTLRGIKYLRIAVINRS